MIYMLISGQAPVKTGTGSWVYCVNRGYSGLENLSLIPGQVGSAPVQNIGAYGVEVKDRVLWVEGMDLEKKEVGGFMRKSAASGTVRASSNKN